MLELIVGALLIEHLLFVTSLNISHFTRYELLKLSILYKFALSHSKTRINHFATTDITHFLLELLFSCTQNVLCRDSVTSSRGEGKMLNEVGTRNSILAWRGDCAGVCVLSKWSGAFVLAVYAAAYW